MKIMIKIAGKNHPLTTPFEGADHAVIQGAGCPHCGAEPCKVAGSGRHIADDDCAYVAEGYCLACQGHVGQIRAEAETIFGLREDERVFFGRCRVY